MAKFMIVAAFGFAVLCGLAYTGLHREEERERVLTELKAVLPPSYEACDATGCCDELPSFCREAVAQFSDGCAYESVAGRCQKSCGNCHPPVPDLRPESACSEPPTCARLKDAIDGMCDIDSYRQQCRSTCGTCLVECEDKRLHKSHCDAAKKDLRLCASSRTRERCPGTCGVCSKVSLKDLLTRQPCADPPQCARSEDDIVNEALTRYRSCLDFEGSCGFTDARPNKTALCSDPTYRDTLCRATCNSCPDGPLPPREPLALPPSPPHKCSDTEARNCPRKCGVCRPRGSRSDWDTSDSDRLVPNVDNLRR
jgi:hypothetical protein